MKEEKENKDEYGKCRIAYNEDGINGLGFCLFGLAVVAGITVANLAVQLPYHNYDSGMMTAH